MRVAALVRLLALTTRRWDTYSGVPEESMLMSDVPSVEAPAGQLVILPRIPTLFDHKTYWT